MRALALVAMLCLADVATAAADATVVLAGADEKVLRRFTVTKVEGQAPPSLTMIRTFDREAKAFVFEDQAGRAVTVPAAQIKEIAFQRAPRAQNPAVQAPLRQVKVVSEASRTVKVAATALAIADNVLTVPTLDPLPALQRDVRWEIRSMRYHRDTQEFAIDVERIRYSETITGCGGSPGMGKGMQ